MRFSELRPWLRRAMLAAVGFPLLAVAAWGQASRPAFEDMVPPGEAALQQLTDQIIGKADAAAPQRAAGTTASPYPATSENAAKVPPLGQTFTPPVPAAAGSLSPVRRLPPEPGTVAAGRLPARPSARPAPVGTARVVGAPPARVSPGMVQLTSGEEHRGLVVSAAAEESIAESTSPQEKPLEPVPEAPQESVTIEAAGFNGITPGVSSLAEVQKGWGEPKATTQQEATTVYLYAVEPFDHVEVRVANDKVASLIIRLHQAFPAAAVAEQLQLGALRPVLVSNAMGDILGQSYPERGVLFGFAPGETPGKPSMQVNQIVLEPVTAEPFVLRAETYLDSRPDWSAADLEAAVQLDASNPRAFWLQARVLSSTGGSEKALEAAGKAVRLEPDNPQYRVTFAQLLGTNGQFAAAVDEAQRTVAASEKRPHIRARALCLLGDLFGSGPQADYRKAMEFHTQAMKLADPLAANPHPAIRIAAKEVLLDSHLGAAHDIAWGVWNQKDAAVERWLTRSGALADDLVTNEGVSPERRMRVGVRALAACVGLQGRLDPAPWAELTLQAAQPILNRLSDGPFKTQIHWELGMAMYDALQACQMRNDYDQALKFGETAIQHLEQSSSPREDPADAYLLGRLYFRTGAIHAVGKRDHSAAVAWFEKARPLLDRTAGSVDVGEYARLGETYVSMGISYWESGDRPRGLELTQQGVDLIEKTVERAVAEPAVLEIPYNNLATMRRQLGQTAEAEALLEKASHLRSTIVR